MVVSNSLAGVSARLALIEDRFNSLDVNFSSSRSRMQSKISEVEAAVGAVGHVGGRHNDGVDVNIEPR